MNISDVLQHREEAQDEENRGNIMETLRVLEAEFDDAGGRGVELADRIDYHRAILGTNEEFEFYLENSFQDGFDPFAI